MQDGVSSRQRVDASTADQRRPVRHRPSPRGYRPTEASSCLSTPAVTNTVSSVLAAEEEQR